MVGLAASTQTPCKTFGATPGEGPGRAPAKSRPNKRADTEANVGPSSSSGPRWGELLALPDNNPADRPTGIPRGQASRHLPADSSNPSECMLMFNLHKAKFVCTQVEAEKVLPATEYLLFTHGEQKHPEEVGQVRAGSTKEEPLESRVQFPDCWLSGIQHGLLHGVLEGSNMNLQGAGSIWVSVRAPKSDEVLVWLHVNPWLAYSCAPGARLVIRDLTDLEGRNCRCVTVKRALQAGVSEKPDWLVVRLDNAHPEEEESCDARPDQVIPAARIRYEPGQWLVCVHQGESVDAKVLPWARRQGDDWKPSGLEPSDGNLHLLEIGLPDAREIVQMDLNSNNHCCQTFDSVKEYEKVRMEYCREMMSHEEKVEDAITGKALRIKDQLLKIEMAVDFDQNLTDWNVQDVHGLVEK